MTTTRLGPFAGIAGTCLIFFAVGCAGNRDQSTASAVTWPDAGEPHPDAGERADSGTITFQDAGSRGADAPVVASDSAPDPSTMDAAVDSIRDLRRGHGRRGFRRWWRRRAPRGRLVGAGHGHRPGDRRGRDVGRGVPLQLRFELSVRDPAGVREPSGHQRHHAERPAAAQRRRPSVASTAAATRPRTTSTTAKGRWARPFGCLPTMRTSPACRRATRRRPSGGLAP